MCRGAALKAANSDGDGRTGTAALNDGDARALGSPLGPINVGPERPVGVKSGAAPRWEHRVDRFTGGAGAGTTGAHAGGSGSSARVRGTAVVP